MRNMTYFTVAGALAASALAVSAGSALGRDRDHGDQRGPSVQLGPRPFYLVEGMDPSPLKEQLEQCKDGPFRRSDFSIGHRGAALQFPEHTKQAYEAGARMGAGVVECDTTFTKDGELVCRHSECDLQTTTNIVATALNAKCSVPWTGPDQTPPPKCCTSDLTLPSSRACRASRTPACPARPLLRAISAAPPAGAPICTAATGR